MEAMRIKRNAYRVWQRLTEDDLLQIKNVNKEPSELVGQLIYALILFTTGQTVCEWPEAKHIFISEPRDFLYLLGKAADSCGGEDYEAGRLFLYGKNMGSAGNYQLPSVKKATISVIQQEEAKRGPFDMEERVAKFKEVVDRQEEFKQANGRTAAVQYMFDFAESICQYVEVVPDMREAIEKYEEYKKNGNLGT